VGEKVSFGDTVSYEIVGSYEIVFLPMPTVHMTTVGQAISQVR